MKLMTTLKLTFVNKIALLVLIEIIISLKQIQITTRYHRSKDFVTTKNKDNFTLTWIATVPPVAPVEHKSLYHMLPYATYR